MYWNCQVRYRIWERNFETIITVKENAFVTRLMNFKNESDRKLV